MEINVMYFSATGTTRKIICTIAKGILINLDKEVNVHHIDFTLPMLRQDPVLFSEKDILIIGVPVYAGRVPNILLKYLNKITGTNTVAIPVVVYGNRNYDDALIELKNILEANGFITIAAAAFIGEHSFSNTLAKGRPDKKDIAIANKFADKIVKTIHKFPDIEEVVVPGEKPLRPYFKPKDKDGNVFNFRKITPQTNDKCIDCKICVSICPMSSIDQEDVSKLNGICIKCCACVKHCPVQAKYFDDPNYIKHKNELEENFQKRREPEIFY